MTTFECENCGCKRLSEVVDNAVVIQEVHIDPHSEGLTYGECELHDGEIDHYMCLGCGSVLRDNKTGEWICDNLAEYIRTNSYVCKTYEESP